LFGQLLLEVQRIKSEWGYNGKVSVDKYGVKVDQKTSGSIEVIKTSFCILQWFCKPNVGPNVDSQWNIISVDFKQPKTFADQMLELKADINVKKIPL
jgi:dipeptidyl-peptidase-3